MNAIEQLKSVLCNHDGKCCIAGSEEDRAIVDRALHALAQPKQEPVAWRYRAATFWNRDVHWRYLETLEGTEGLQGLKPLYTTPQPQEFVCSTGLCHYKANKENA